MDGITELISGKYRVLGITYSHCAVMHVDLHKASASRDLGACNQSRDTLIKHDTVLVHAASAVMSHRQLH